MVVEVEWVRRQNCLIGMCIYRGTMYNYFSSLSSLCQLARAAGFKSLVKHKRNGWNFSALPLQTVIRETRVKHGNEGLDFPSLVESLMKLVHMASFMPSPIPLSLLPSSGRPPLLSAAFNL